MKSLIGALVLSSLAGSSAMATGPGDYSCVTNVRSALGDGKRDMRAYKRDGRAPFERFGIVISTGSTDLGAQCVTAGEPGLFTGALCSAPYQAQVIDGDQVMRFFGDNPAEFRGHSVYSYLSISGTGFLLSYSLFGIVYTQAGLCEAK
jgi:hypothetical protein